jgi:NDP-sugar pyrophosphorylase family protein
MKAMIFAAGLGTRLRPMTDTMPKALVPVGGVPMLQIVIERLKNAGVTAMIINVHHRAHDIQDFLEKNKNFNIDIALSNEHDQLLDTGGGLKKASWFFDDKKPFFVHNADVLCNANLRAFHAYHCAKGGLATLMVRHRTSNRFFLFDHDMQLCGWRNTKSGDEIIARPADMAHALPFSTLHIVDPAIFSHMQETGAFSIVDVYLRLAATQKIFGYIDDQSYWMDIGTIEKLEQANNAIDDVESFVR